MDYTDSQQEAIDSQDGILQIIARLAAPAIWPASTAPIRPIPET